MYHEIKKHVIFDSENGELIVEFGKNETLSTYNSKN